MGLHHFQLQAEVFNRSLIKEGRLASLGDTKEFGLARGKEAKPFLRVGDFGSDGRGEPAALRRRITLLQQAIVNGGLGFEKVANRAHTE